MQKKKKKKKSGVKKCEFHVAVPGRTCLWEVFLGFKWDRFSFSKTPLKTGGHEFFFFSPKRKKKNSSFLSPLLYACCQSLSFENPPFSFFFISVFPKGNFHFSHKKKLPLSFLQNSDDSPSIDDSPFPHAKKAKKYDLENL